MSDTTQSVMDQIVSLCKRRGFVYPASEIYGGLRGFWDYGPLGVLLKNNIRDWWWRCMVECPPIGPDGHPVDIVGLDSAIIQHPMTWKASGHVDNFNDPTVDCRETQGRYRADHVKVLKPVDGIGHSYAFVDDREAAEKKIKRDARRNVADYTAVVLTTLPLAEYANVVGPDAKKAGTLTEPRAFSLMLGSEVGVVDQQHVYLRPETAQGIFLQFKNVADTTRVKVPFGIAQIGKSFRNEVTPRNFIFRSREFEQMEMEFFCPPDQAIQWYQFWRGQRMNWWLSLGIKPENLIFHDCPEKELPFYSKAAVDIEYKYPFTAPDFGELESLAHRGDYDLTQHQKHSGQKLDYFDQDLQLKLKAEGASPEDVKSKSRYIPSVIEPASGLTRAVLVLLCEGYRNEPGRAGTEEYFSFKPQFAPIKCGIFPLVNKDGMPEVAEKLYLQLRQRFTCEYDAKQSIGKRYARMDEIGTPFCVTIDGQTLVDQTVTVRERDSMAQHRLAIDGVRAFVENAIAPS